MTPANIRLEPTRGAHAQCCGRRARLKRRRYAGRTESFFSPGFLPHRVFNDESGPVRGFGRNGSGSFEHPSGLQQLGVGFVERGLPSGGAPLLRRTWQCAGVGLHRVLVWREARAFEQVGSRCSRGCPVGAALLRRTA